MTAQRTPTRILTRITLHITEPGREPYASSFDRTDPGPRGLKIGKDVRYEIPLTDPTVAKMHAVIELNVQGAKLIDLGSGSKVNDKEVNTANLRSGDRITVGETLITVAELSEMPFTEPPIPVAPTETRNEVPPPPMPSSAPPPVNRRRAPPPPTRVTLLQVLAWTTWSAAKRVIARGVRALRAIEAADSLGDK